MSIGYTLTFVDQEGYDTLAPLHRSDWDDAHGSGITMHPRTDWYGHSDFITEPLKRYLSDRGEIIHMCGPPGMIDAMVNKFRKLGL